RTVVHLCISNELFFNPKYRDLHISSIIVDSKTPSLPAQSRYQAGGWLNGLRQDGAVDPVRANWKRAA
ncbi:uncharacterized protein PgNI_00766, partial [Pyricularia grisea]|uniref:Uncharacterized protein n=1 Tax=Pyricularia grisea TaxID=148305 RepID=A0A6P8BJK8_PYRGI